MKSTLRPQLGADHQRMMQERVRSLTQVRAHGTQRIPAIPRGLVPHSAQGGSMVTWHLPTRYDDVTGYRIYTGSERNLAMEIRDRGTRQLFVPLAAGATASQRQNVFVSVVNGFREGPRLQIQASALPTSAAQSIPLPSRDFSNMFSGGLDKTQNGQPTGKKTP